MIRPGDLVRTVGAVPLTAEVIATSREGARRGHLLVWPVCGAIVRPGTDRTRDVRVRDVETHWRRAGARRTAAAA